MVVFLVWEAYSNDWVLVKKGSRFMSVENPSLIDFDVETFSREMAEHLHIELEYLVVTSVQQLNIPE